MGAHKMTICPAKTPRGAIFARVWTFLAGSALVRAVCAFMLLAAALSPAAAQRGAYPVKIDGGGATEVSKSLVLPLNKAAVVELPQAAADVLVSQPTVVDAVVRSPRRVYLLGLGIGQTNAFFFDARGRQILNLEIQVERDVDALTDVMRRVMPDSRIEVESINDTLILRGHVQTAAEAENARLLAFRFVDGDEDKVVNMLTIRDRAQVMLKVRIVEMQRQLLKQLGVETSGTVRLSNAAFNFAATNAISNAGGIALEGNRVGSGNLEDIDANLQAFESTGLVRVLAEPNLTALSGESARFLAGGEFPVPIGQEDGVITIEFKEFGVGLGFTPLVLGKGRINLKIATEVSEITTENSFFIPGETGFDENGNPITTAGLSIPGLSVRRANTVVELPSGGSLMMAGLLQEDMRASIDGVPGMKDVPILGQLFRSRNYNNNETELVVLITPYLVDPSHENRLTDPSEGFVPASDAQSMLLGKMVSTYGLAGTGVKEASLQGPLGFILD